MAGHSGLYDSLSLGKIEAADLTLQTQNKNRARRASCARGCSSPDGTAGASLSSWLLGNKPANAVGLPCVPQLFHHDRK